MVTATDRLAAIRAALGPLQQVVDGAGEVAVDTALFYRPDDAIRIRVRRRGHRYDLTDDGAAAMLALRLAKTTSTVYLALLELGDLHQWVGRSTSMLSPRCPPCVT